MTTRRDDLAIETHSLGKRFGAKWALKECSLSVPKGRVTALVGPNGAGKTTLLRMLVGLAAPSAGSALVLGQRPRSDSEFLRSVGYLAQDVPLYKRLSARDHLQIGSKLNAEFDQAEAESRLSELGIPLDRPVSTLSGGQRAQVGLGLALAKHPQVLLLDEPVAALDPLARREFLGALSAAVAEGNLSVVMSSHLLHDLERVCDHVILLSSARPQLCADIDEVLAEHRLLVGAKRPTGEYGGGFDVVKATHTANQTRLLVRLHSHVIDPAWEVHEVGLEEVILAYMAQHDHLREPQLVAVGGGM